MSLIALQTHLKRTGRYAGAVDNIWGRLTEAGVLLMLTDGPDTLLTDKDFAASADRLRCRVAAIRAFWKVEANGVGFFAGRPKILPEPHRFSKATKGRFDKSDPTVSYPAWGTRPYPATQDDRYDMLLRMVRLDVEAGFGSVSYGAPQIMGENHATCGYASAMLFADAMARDEVTQLQAFERFVTAAGIIPFLRAATLTPASWEPVAKRYNGTAYRVNRYHEKMAAAYKAFGGK